MKYSSTSFSVDKTPPTHTRTHIHTNILQCNMLSVLWEGNHRITSFLLMFAGTECTVSDSISMSKHLSEKHGESNSVYVSKILLTCNSVRQKFLIMCELVTVQEDLVLVESLCRHIFFMLHSIKHSDSTNSDSKQVQLKIETQGCNS